MQESSSGPCAETSRRNAVAVARAEGQPADDAEDQPVVDEREHRAHARQDPAGEGGERDLDVVRHHLASRTPRLVGAEVAPLGRRVGGRLQLGGDEPERRAGVARRPQRAGRGRQEQQRPGDASSRRALGDPPPVAAREELHTRRAAALPVDGAAAAGDSPSSRAPPGRPGSAGGRRRGRPPRRGTARRARARPSGPSRSAAAARPRSSASSRSQPGPRSDSKRSRFTAPMEYEDTRTIATPEGVELELRLAGVGSRFMRRPDRLADQGVLVLARDRCSATPAARRGRPGGRDRVPCCFAMVVYDVAVRGPRRRPHARQARARPARRARRRRPVDLRASAIRNLIRLIEGSPLLYVPAIVDPRHARNQRLGDLAGRHGRRRERPARRGAAAVAARADPPGACDPTGTSRR